MQRDNLSFLLDMRFAARDGISFISGQTYDEFINDRKTQFATSKAIEVVGESASQVSPDFKKRIRRFRGETLWECAIASFMPFLLPSTPMSGMWQITAFRN